MQVMEKIGRNVLPIYIGYDEVEIVAFHTLCQSIIDNSSIPVSIIPINLKNLGDVFYRRRDEKQSNEFSFSRFLVPFLNDYLGFAVFLDCDMLFRTDIKDLLDLVDPKHAVSVVKHNYKPRDDIKYLNNVQYTYPRKNWSSVIVWNCSHPSNRRVDVDYVNTATGLELHRFKWLKDDEIGELPVVWNWLVGEYTSPSSQVLNVHWTNGGPYFEEYSSVDFSDEWEMYRERILYCKQRGSNA